MKLTEIVNPKGHLVLVDARLAEKRLANPDSGWKSASEWKPSEKAKRLMGKAAPVLSPAPVPAPPVEPAAKSKPLDAKSDVAKLKK